TNAGKWTSPAGLIVHSPSTSQLAYFGDSPNSICTTNTLTADLVQICDGSNSAFRTVASPVLAISRYEQISSSSGCGACGIGALYVELIANGISISGGNPNSNGINVQASQTGNGDVVGVTGQAYYTGTINSGHAAFGGFFSGTVTTVGNNAFAIQAGVLNNT